MAGSTPIYGFPYPESSDLVANYPALGEQLAEDIESTISGLPAAGLTLVSPTSIANSGGSASASGGEVTFTGVSSVSLNGVFTSVYTNYLVQIAVNSGTALTELYMRMRASGSDNSASNYKYANWDADSNSGTGASSSNGTTQFLISGNINGIGSATNLQVFNPNTAVETRTLNHSFGHANYPYMRIGAGVMTITTVYDGFTFYPGTGNITGNVRVYGYKNN